MVVLQLIIIILSLELKFTHFEVAFGEDKESLVSEEADKSAVEALTDWPNVMDNAKTAAVSNIIAEIIFGSLLLI